ncbi:TatD family deoxyribonuclease [Candidatus Woesearchaeota archaeon]|nr:MAG: TatD family deoxyribonuclease [Candidatus Woesearchaeota archaeon]
MFVDVHAHLDFEQFSEDLDYVISRATDNGVVTIISNGVNPESNRLTMALADKYSIVKPALGLYPTDGIKLTDEQIDKEVKYILKSKPVAIGEIGLDLKHLSSLSEQKSVFEKMLAVAEKLNVPVIVHTRMAEEAVLDTLESSNVKKVVLHTFMGKLKLAKRAEDNGYYFSIPPIITYSSQLQELAKRVSVSRLLTETDSPFLSHNKGQRNEPVNVKVVVNKIAELKGLDQKETENIIYTNFVRLF